ncbi:hypothetical protein ISN76_16130 [Dyella halodurans]|uniref:Uncharacterized protein n=1 Tax=Dyella halodurans TaxID=1920171 RepID=A0ABV9C7A4_9GAMM|nr:hypothetical protein [Dyella halodurans]
MAALAPVSSAHRARVLRALGVTPWVRRLPPEIVTATAEVTPAAVSSGECVVLLPAGCSQRELDLLGRALMTSGATVARAPRIEVSKGQLPAAPEARAYLVFGEAQAHALGRELPAATLSRAHIVLADEPAGILASAAGKRRLWNALRSLRRALAAPME